MLVIRIGISLKAIASDAIYRKALRLTSSAKGTTSTGQLVNIMSTDTSILLQFMMIISILVMIPVMVFFFFCFSCLVGNLYFLDCSTNG